MGGAGDHWGTSHYNTCHDEFASSSPNFFLSFSRLSWVELGTTGGLHINTCHDEFASSSPKAAAAPALVTLCLSVWRGLSDPLWLQERRRPGPNRVMLCARNRLGLRGLRAHCIPGRARLARLLGARHVRAKGLLVEQRVLSAEVGHGQLERGATYTRACHA